jgi:RNA polymerase sigma-70 factor, ECF subfamily
VVTSPLTKLEYHTVFDRLFGQDQASAESYMRLHQTLIKFFLWRQVNSADADDLADEVIDRLLKKVADGSVELDGHTIMVYAHAVARNLYLEYLRRARHLAAASEKKISDLRQVSEVRDLEAEELERRLQLLDECLDELRPSDRELVMSFYRSDRQERYKLADRFGISKASLWTRLHRIRSRLEKSLTEKMRAENTEVHRAHN